MRFPYDVSYADATRLFRHAETRLAYGALAIALLAAPFALSPFYLGELTYLLILSIASLGLMVLKGYSGQVSLGPSAFVAIGAYAHAILLNAGVPFLVSLPCAAGIAGLAGALVGIPAIRVSGLYLAMVTLAFAVIVEHVLVRWKSLTGGFNGLEVPTPEILGLRMGSPRSFYFLCLAVLVLLLIALVNLMRGSVGRILVAIRESESASLSLGIWVAAWRVLAFVLSSLVLGAAGALMSHHLQFLTPDGFSLLLSLELVLAVVIGGLGSLRGAVLGAFLVGLLPSIISHIKPVLPDRLAKQFGIEIFVYGLVLLTVVLFEPTGLNGRWTKIKAFFSSFPFYRRDMHRRVKTYLASERYK